MKRTGGHEPGHLKRFAASGFFAWRALLLAFDELLV
jgi:hypothetical protein